MEKIAAAAANTKPQIGDVRQQSIVTIDKSLFAAFINTDTAVKPDNSKPEVPTADDQAQNVAPQQPDAAPPEHAHKGGGGKHKAAKTENNDDSKPVKSTDQKPAAKQVQKPSDKKDAKPADDTKPEVAQDPNAPADTNAVAEEIAPEVTAKPVKTAKEAQKPDAKIVKVKEDQPEEPVAVAAVIVVPVQNEKQGGGADAHLSQKDGKAETKKDPADDLLTANLTASKPVIAPKGPEQAEKPVGKNAADAGAPQALDAATGKDALIDLAVDAKPDAQLLHNDHPRSENSAQDKGDAKIIDIQQFAAGGRQASPLLPTPNQLALPQIIANAGAPSAASSPSNITGSSDVAARPLGFLAQQTDAGKAHEVRLSRMPANTSSQVQEQIAIKLRYAAKAGDKSMTINLRPDELGRIDIKLDFKDGNQVSAKIVADNQYTLDMMKKDSAALEQVLSDAGLHLNGEGLQFDLRDSSQQMRQQDFAGTLKGGAGGKDEDVIEQDVAAVVETNSNNVVADGRVDISI